MPPRLRVVIMSAVEVEISSGGMESCATTIRALRVVPNPIPTNGAKPKILFLSVPVRLAINPLKREKERKATIVGKRTVLVQEQ